MAINDIDQQHYVDLFGEGNGGLGMAPSAKFGMTNDNDIDIFATVTQTTTEAPTTGETTTLPPDGTTTDTTTLDPNTPKDTDIFSGEDTKGKGRPKKYAFEDASGYFEDRVKSGKFVSINETMDDGSEKPFIPKTPEEFDEFLQIQVDTQLNNRKKEVEEGWYAAKTPAWKAVARYAEMVDSPEQLLPFLQGVQTIESVKDLDEKDIDGAERIVRIRMAQKGDAQDVIDEQIDSLKTTDKLISTAAKYKPVILNEETQRMQQMIQREKAAEQQYNQMVDSIRENTIKVIETPMFGKHKLKQEEKVAIFNLVGLPGEEGGYQIYNRIDSLFEQGKFDTLAKIALLLEKEDSFLGYISASAADKTAGDLQRKLKVANTGSGSTKDTDDGEEVKQVVQRKPSFGAARFGR